MVATIQLEPMVAVWGYTQAHHCKIQRNQKHPNIYVKYLDLVVPETHFKFFKLTDGPDFVVWPSVYNLWPVCHVQVNPAL